MRGALLAVCGVGLSAVAWGPEPPTPRIDGPDRIDRDTVAVYTLPAAGQTLIDPPAGLSVQARGAEWFVAGRPGTYVLSGVWVDFDAQRIAFVKKTIVIAGQPDPPGPDPTTLTGVAKASYDGAARVPESARGRDRTALAKANRGHASAVAAGAFAGPSQILAGWRAANKEAADPSAWGPWGEAVGAAIESEYKADRLKDNAAWAALFNEVARGLEAK